MFVNVLVGKNASCGATDGQYSIIATGGTAPYSYVWADSYVGSSRNNMAPGNYIVTITDAAGCTMLYNITVTETCGVCNPANLNIPRAVDDNIPVTRNSPYTGNVATNDVVYSGSGNEWNRMTQPSNGTLTFNTNGSFTYTPNTGFTGIDGFTYSLCNANGQCSKGTVNISVNAPGCNLSAGIVPQSPSCVKGGDGSLTALVTVGSGSYSYLWNTGSVSQTMNNLVAGKYRVKITDNITGCVQNISTNLCDPKKLKADITIVNAAGCGSSAFVLPRNGTPPYSYRWNDGSTAQNRTNMCAGSYFVLVTDSKGCTSGKYVVQIGACKLYVNLLGSQDVTCSSTGCDGSVSILATGGTAPYTYSWSDGGTGSTRTNLCEGVYVATITDVLGCSITYSWTIRKDCQVCVRPNEQRNAIPIAVNDTVTTSVNAPYNGTVAGNDYLSTDGGNVWKLVTQPTNGTVVFNTDGSYTYTPGATTGTDLFQYSLCDIDYNCSVATVRITIGSALGFTNGNGEDQKPVLKQ